jgi:hypothetical protein
LQGPATAGFDGLINFISRSAGDVAWLVRDGKTFPHEFDDVFEEKPKGMFRDISFAKSGIKVLQVSLKWIHEYRIPKEATF